MPPIPAPIALSITDPTDDSRFINTQFFKITGQSTTPGLRTSLTFHQAAVYVSDFYSFSTVIHRNWKHPNKIEINTWRGQCEVEQLNWVNYKVPMKPETFLRP